MSSIAARSRKPKWAGWLNISLTMCAQYYAVSPHNGFPSEVRRVVRCAQDAVHNCRRRGGRQTKPAAAVWSPVCPASPSGSIHGPASRKAPESGRVRPQRRAAVKKRRRAPGGGLARRSRLVRQEPTAAAGLSISLTKAGGATVAACPAAAARSGEAARRRGGGGVAVGRRAARGGCVPARRRCWRWRCAQRGGAARGGSSRRWRPAAARGAAVARGRGGDRGGGAAAGRAPQHLRSIWTGFGQVSFRGGQHAPWRAI